MSTWKSLERRLASLLGGERVPVTGRTGARGQETPDITHPIFAIEVKHRANGLPAWCVAARTQAHASRKPHHVAEVAIIHAKSQRLEDSAVIMPLSDLLEIQRRLDQAAETARMCGSVGHVPAEPVAESP